MRHIQPVLSEELFYQKITALANKRGSSHVKEPTIGQTKLSLYQLYLEVNRYGGYELVCQDRAWRRIADTFGLPATCTNAAYNLKQNYLKFILDLYEDESFAAKTASDAAVKISSDSRPILAESGMDLDASLGSSLDWKLRIRLIRSLQCGIVDEIGWALDELLKFSTGGNVFYLASIPELSVTLLEMLCAFLSAMQSEKDAEFYSSGLKRIVVFLWNVCCSNSKNCRYLVLNDTDLLKRAVNQMFLQFDCILQLNAHKAWLDFVSLICKEPRFQLDTELQLQFEMFIVKNLMSNDRQFRLIALEILTNLLSNSANTRWFWKIFERKLSDAIFFNSIISDEQIQISVIDLFFALSDSFEAFHSDLNGNSFPLSKFCFAVDILFHVIFDNFSFSKHLKNIPYRNILKNQSLNTAQLLGKWLVLCYVPSTADGETVSSRDVYRQFEMFCAREGIPDGPIDWSTFIAKVKEVYPKCMSQNISADKKKRINIDLDSAATNGNYPFNTHLRNSFHSKATPSLHFALKSRDWSERVVKTTEKVVNAILALRNFALLPIPNEIIDAAFTPYFASICHLASISDSKNNFISKHFSLILSELFCREQ